MQNQRNLNLALSMGNTDQGAYRNPEVMASSISGDNHTERPASPADLRDVGSVTNSTLRGETTHSVPAEAAKSPFVTNTTGQKISHYAVSREAADWFYLEA
jgi:hypothetical protein